MSTTKLFIDATGPITCLNIFRQWSQSFHGGCASVVMDESADRLLLPCALIFSGSRRGRLFKHDRSEFQSTALTYPAKMAALHGVQVPLEFLAYFRRTIRTYPVTPLPVLSLLETGSDSITREVERVVAHHRATKPVHVFDTYIGAIAHPTAIFLTVETDAWHIFWTYATRFRVLRKGCSRQMDPLADCTYVVDFTTALPETAVKESVDYSDPDKFMQQFEERYRAAAEYWIITKRDAFLILMAMSVIYPKVDTLLRIPTLNITH